MQNSNLNANSELSLSPSLSLSLRIGTWNVNSINVRLSHVLDLLQSQNIDLLCLQELKVINEKFPYEAFKQAGYLAFANGQPTYNGVAWLIKESTAKQLNISAECIHANNPFYIEDVQKRLITLSIPNLMHFVCAYMPNGESLESDKFIYKMHWLEKMLDYIKHLQLTMPVALLGDYNITVDELDVYDAQKWQGIHCSAQERTLFTKLNQLNMYDTLRTYDANANYTWWDYRLNSFKRNMGLRIDHIFMPVSHQAQVKKVWVEKSVRHLERPSDHAPVLLDFVI